MSLSRRLQVTRERHDRGDAGFTLVELLISVIVIPLVVGAIAVALIAVFSLQGTSTKRIADASDAQVVSSNFESDVHAALQITTQTSPACGASTQTQLLGLQWNSDAAYSNGYQDVVSYVVVAQGSTDALVRQFCSSGSSTTPTSSTQVAFGVASTLPAPTVAPTTLAATTSWVNAASVTGVTWAITEPASGFAYSVVATPAAGSSTVNLPGVVNPTNSCSLANPGTGTYASKLCFVDFSSFTPTAQINDFKNGTCTNVTSAIVGSADTLSMCVGVSSSTSTASQYPYTPNPIGNLTTCPTGPFGLVCPATIPTYYYPGSPNGSEAYLGNNGFYTGVAGRPALYQVILSGTVTLTFNNIQLTNSSGTVISGWSLATGDAESTDAGESINWTTSSSATFSSSKPGPVLNLLPNSPGGSQINDIGNACAYSGDTASGTVGGTAISWPNTDLTGLGTTSVLCGANVQSDKTGTVMLSAAEPSTPAQWSMQVVLSGSEEAVFIGVLLP